MVPEHEQQPIKDQNSRQSEQTMPKQQMFDGSNEALYSETIRS